jgi:hypothetical protein
MVCDLMRRSHRPPAPDSNVVTDVINTIVTGIQNGTDFSSAYPTIHRLINQQEHRANLVNQLMIFDDFRRAAALLEIRNILENELISAARNDTLRPAERLVLLQIVDERLKSTEHRIAGGSVDIQDVVGLLQKANYAIESQGDNLRKKFSKTSEQGREIIRKLVTRVGRELKVVTPDDTHGKR